MTELQEVKPVKKKTSVGKKAVGAGALLAVLIPLLIAIVGEIDGAAVGKRVNTWLITPAAAISDASTPIPPPEEKSAIPDVAIVPGKKDQPEVKTYDLFSSFLQRLDTIDKILDTIKLDSTSEKDKLTNLKFEIEVLKKAIGILEGEFSSAKEDWNDFLRAYHEDEKKVLEMLSTLRERLSFIEGKIDKLGGGGH